MIGRAFRMSFSPHSSLAGVQCCKQTVSNRHAKSVDAESETLGTATGEKLRYFKRGSAKQ